MASMPLSYKLHLHKLTLGFLFYMGTKLVISVYCLFQIFKVVQSCSLLWELFGWVISSDIIVLLKFTEDSPHLLNFSSMLYYASGEGLF